MAQFGAVVRNKHEICKNKKFANGSDRTPGLLHVYDMWLCKRIRAAGGCAGQNASAYGNQRDLAGHNSIETPSFTSTVSLYLQSHTMHFITIVLAVCASIAPVHCARANFNVHYPWLTRQPPPIHRSGLDRFEPFCGEYHANLWKCSSLNFLFTGDIKLNPQRFSGYQRTFLSFSSDAGDLGTSNVLSQIKDYSNY